MINFQTDPAQYRHWRVDYQGAIAYLTMDVDEDAGLFDGYQLKLNSYDLGVDIELADIVQRMRFEHPEVAVVVMQSGKDRVFCAGANIRMLGGASHTHKVNFCKFTNETRNTYEAAEADSQQKYIAAIKGSCAGGGYELALACNYLMLTNDSSSAVALPEVPLLAVLPGTGGLTRVTDKRQVRRDRADIFCSLEEGIRGDRAKAWKLVDEVVPNARFDEVVQERATGFAGDINKPDNRNGISLQPLQRQIDADGSVQYTLVNIKVDRAAGTAELTLHGPTGDCPDNLTAQGDQMYFLKLARELDDAILHLRFNEAEVGLLVFKTVGDIATLLAHEQQLHDNSDHWLINEVLMYWKRLLKRIDVTSRSMVSIVEHGSCFGGVLAELLFATDRSYMMDGEFEEDNRAEAAITLTTANFGAMPMGNGLTRLQTRFIGDEDSVAAAQQSMHQPLNAADAEALGLITFALDDIDWEDEIRIFLEERASFSPDAMTGMEANLRFAGPETMETRIFGRLTAWQNWIFNRPNAVGENGALQRYGTGKRGEFSKERV
ncbi:MAG: 2,3-epoxybenzoyl-CoA dihydrolase [Pseudomonadota bacterium]